MIFHGRLGWFMYLFLMNVKDSLLCGDYQGNGCFSVALDFNRFKSDALEKHLTTKTRKVAVTIAICFLFVTFYLDPLVLLYLSM